MTAELISRLFSQHRFTFGNEKDLQASLARVLKDAGFPFVRECAVVGGVIDFMVGDIGVEIKIKGDPSAVARQLVRYTREPRIREVLLVSTNLKHRAVHSHLADCCKPIKTLILIGSSL